MYIYTHIYMTYVYIYISIYIYICILYIYDIHIYLMIIHRFSSLLKCAACAVAACPPLVSPARDIPCP